MHRLDALSDLRYRRAALTTLAAGVASLSSVVVTFLTIPIILHHLGAESFGFYMTLATAISLLGWLDLGVGLGLLNILSACNGRDDRDGAKRYVSSAFFAILGLAVAFSCLFAAVYTFIPWEKVFNTPPQFGDEVRTAVIVLAVCIALSMPIGLVNRIQAAYQRGYLNSLWDILARILILIGVLLAVKFDASLPLILLVVLGMPVISSAINMLTLFGFSLPWLRPSPTAVESVKALEVVNKGGLFVLLQLVTAAAFGSDNVVILHVIGPAAVSDYTVARTFYQMAATATLLALMPLWPAYGEALAKGEKVWISQTLKWSLLLATLLSAAAALLLTGISKWALPFWVGHPVDISYGLLSGFGAFIIVTTAGNALAMLLNAASIIRFQAFTSIAMGTVALLAKIIFGKHFGLSGIIWGTVISYVLLSLIPTLLYVRRWISRFY